MALEQWHDASMNLVAEIEDDGTLVFHHTGTVWEDLRVPLERAKFRGAGVPQYGIFRSTGAGSVGIHSYRFRNGDELFFQVQMPHAWKLGTMIYPHLHWSPSTNTDPRRAVGIGLEYVWCNIGDAFGSTTVITRDVSTGVNQRNVHLMDNFDDSGIDATGHTLSSIIYGRIFRQAAAAADYEEPAWFHAFDIHYEVDTLGSRQVVSK